MRNRVWCLIVMLLAAMSWREKEKDEDAAGKQTGRTEVDCLPPLQKQKLLSMWVQVGLSARRRFVLLGCKQYFPSAGVKLITSLLIRRIVVI